MTNPFITITSNASYFTKIRKQLPSQFQRVAHPILSFICLFKSLSVDSNLIDYSKEVFTTPSVIPEDKELFVPGQLTISDKELNTAKKSLRKLSIPDSIFKMRTASYSTLPTEICESAELNTPKKVKNFAIKYPGFWDLNR